MQYVKGGVSLTALQRRIEREYGKSINDILHDMYVTKRMTMKEISIELDVNLRTIQRWAKECGITARKMTWI